MNIKSRPHVSDYPQMHCLVYQLILLAKDGGLNEEQAEAIGSQLMFHYGKCDGELFWANRAALLDYLNLPDDQCPGPLWKV